MLLAESGWDVTTLAERESVAEPVEDGETFEANALLKAEYYGRQFDVPCVADDSGLEVDALHGMPGVYSARYAGEGCTYADNNRKLLAELGDTPAPRRTARFVCVAAFFDPNGESHVCRGVVAGTIAPECRGSLGFGYDPLFIPAGSNKTFAELDPREKSRISHRGQAFRAMANYLRRHPA